MDYKGFGGLVAAGSRALPNVRAQKPGAIQRHLWGPPLPGEGRQPGPGRAPPSLAVGPLLRLLLFPSRSGVRAGPSPSR